MLLGSTGNRAQFRRRSSFKPWNRPQSTRILCPSLSTRNFDPVTVPAPPKKESVRVSLCPYVFRALVASPTDL